MMASLPSLLCPLILLPTIHLQFVLNAPVTLVFWKVSPSGFFLSVLLFKKILLSLAVLCLSFQFLQCFLRST